MQLPKIDVQPLKLAQLLNDMKAGRLLVPRFQRNFIWSLAKTRALLDSMYKEYPIGTFFFWRAPSNATSLFRPLTELNIYSTPNGQPVSYILDGQQRLTSLYVTIEGIKLDTKDYNRICIDLDAATRYDQSLQDEFNTDIFVSRSGDNHRYIAVHKLVGSEHLSIYNKVPQEWQQAFNKAYNLLQTYPFSVVWIQEQNLEDAIEIFQRINQSGKKLTRYDLLCANVWTETFDFREIVDGLNRRFERKGFGKLGESVFTQTFALILKDNCTTEAELSLTTDEIINNQPQIAKSLELAIDFLVNNLGVKRAEYLPYQGILTVLSHYFYRAVEGKISAHEREFLWNWFWQVTLSERYSASTAPKMAEDARKLQSLKAGEDIVFNYSVKITPEAVARTKMTTTASALRNATICMLALKQPKNLRNGSPVDVKDSFFSSVVKAERHHIFSDNFLRNKKLSSQQVHLLPNFCFIPVELNQDISIRTPSEYLNEYQQVNPEFEAAATSHLLLIDSNAAIWRDDFATFIEERSQLIANELKRMLDMKPDGVVPSTNISPLIEIANKVDQIEVSLRNLIDHRLKSVIGTNYWKLAIPSDVITYTKERIKERLDKHPHLDWGSYPPGRSRLDFCDVAHYEKILLKNWGGFEELFKMKDELQRHISAYRTIRNCVQHNRIPTEIETKNGEAAILWLESVIDKYDRKFASPKDLDDNDDEPLDQE